ncbi:glycosyl hydrolase family 10 [Acetobacteraceae bacterium AT-5844]|nr:glycosyl hydrolase family 10 [Acetobacteraceae bacterium AT-5844]
MAQQQGMAALAAEKGVLFGSTLTRGQADESAEMRRLARQEMGAIVPGFEFKWPTLRPGPWEFDFSGAEAMLRLAEEQGQKTRGHALVWHGALPGWFGDGPADAMGMRTLLRHHIDTVARRYAGRIHSWDVVNEPVEPWDGRQDGLRDSPFLRSMGTDYIDLSFRWAAEADPQARLVLNEYGVEMATAEQEARRTALLRLVEGMLRRRVPLHAIGIQAHLAAARQHEFEAEVLRRFIRRIAALGLDCYITELDVTDRGLPPDIATRDAAVAHTYRVFLDAALAEPSVKAVILWGISDRYTWMNDSRFARREDGLPTRPHPFDADFRPKPAWDAIREAFRAASAR